MACNHSSDHCTTDHCRAGNRSLGHKDARNRTETVQESPRASATVHKDHWETRQCRTKIITERNETRPFCHWTYWGGHLSSPSFPLSMYLSDYPWTYWGGHLSSPSFPLSMCLSEYPWTYWGGHLSSPSFPLSMYLRGIRQNDFRPPSPRLHRGLKEER